MILNAIIVAACILIWSFPWQKFLLRDARSVGTVYTNALEYRLSSTTTPLDTPVRAGAAQALDTIVIQLLCLGMMLSLCLVGWGVVLLRNSDWTGAPQIVMGLLFVQLLFNKLTNKCADYVEEYDWE